jgi:SAM-dependent methyltransferase
MTHSSCPNPTLFPHKLAVLERKGVVVPKDAAILDFGCGAGATVYDVLDRGYTNVFGFDVVDYLNLRDESDRARFFINADTQIPCEDEKFDLVISDQVFEHVLDQPRAFAEIYRVLKKGGWAVHVIPARYFLVEPHVKVPLGGLIGNWWWYKFWALAGIRNEFQKGFSSSATADANVKFFKEGLKYVGNSTYRKMWREIGYEFHFVEQEYMETSERPRTRQIGMLSGKLPFALWAIRNFWARIVVMRKPLDAN